MAAVIDSKKCISCGECVSSCLLGAIYLPCRKNAISVIDSDICGDCGVCINVCPAEAIALQGNGIIGDWDRTGVAIPSPNGAQELSRG